MSAMLLEVENVSKNFGGLQAVRNVAMSIERGEIVGLIGPNGAGKTTFFNLIAGVYPPTSGRIRFNGKDIAGHSPAKINRAGIARTFQIPRPFNSMTVRENICVGLIGRPGAKAPEEEAADLAEAVGIAHKLDSRADGLSTGQRKRLELARALSTRPLLLLLDEVTGGVDQRSIPGLIELVREIRKRGVTLIVIEHNMSVMKQLAERIVAFHLGEKIAEGSPNEISQHPDIVRSYLGDSFL